MNAASGRTICGRVLSHPQEPPLKRTGFRRDLGQDRGLRAAGGTNGQSDGGAFKPFH